MIVNYCLANLICILVSICIQSTSIRAELVQATFHLALKDKKIEVGLSKTTGNVISLMDCGRFCTRTEDCIGFHFEDQFQGTYISENYSNCEMHIGKENEFPISLTDHSPGYFYQTGSKNPLQVTNTCQSIDSSLSYQCSKSPSADENSCSGSVNCTVTFENHSVMYDIKMQWPVTPEFAPRVCESLNARLIEIKNDLIQDWLCNVLYAFCGNSELKSFSLGLHKETQDGAWIYNSDSKKVGTSSYQNWFDTEVQDTDLCVIMQGGDPYHFKWLPTSCEDYEHYIICEKDLP